VKGWWKKELDEEGNPSWEWYVDKDAGIGYVRLTSFNEDSFDDFIKAINQMKAERELRGLVLDLRHNPGGLLNSAVKFSNLFVEKGMIVSCQDGERNQVWRKDARAHWAHCKNLPLVVLVNQGSASASEIVSGCLQSHEVAVVVGDRTFGKGSVQSLAPFGEAALKLTTQYYALPPKPGEKSGRLVHKVPGALDWGVNPDLTVEMDFSQINAAVTLRKNADLIADWDEDRDPEDRPKPDPLIADGLDPQLEMALLLLRARLLEPENPGHLVTSS
jgi:carboxyl-terminal processing protease